MPSILNLKFKGNKSFVAFSNLSDSEALTKTWKVCTKVASFLEQGQRLENLSWRLWHLHNLMVDTDNARSKREFKKLSKIMGDRLDKEKGRSIEELEAPDYKPNHSADIIRQRAAEKERSREASHNAAPGTIKRMNFTFSVDTPSPPSNAPVQKPDLKPSAEFLKRPSHAVRSSSRNDDDMVVVAPDDNEGNDKDPPQQATGTSHSRRSSQATPTALHFPTLFSNDFGPAALLFPTPTLTNSMNYGEGLNQSPSRADTFSIIRPTIEIPLDDIMSDGETPGNTAANLWNFQYPQHTATPDLHHPQPTTSRDSSADLDIQMRPPVATVSRKNSRKRKAASLSMTPIRPFDASEDESSLGNGSDDEGSDYNNPKLSRRNSTNTPSASGIAAVTTRKRGATIAGPSASPSLPPAAIIPKEYPQTVAPSKVNNLYDARSPTPVGRPALTLRTQATPATRSSGPGATATSLGNSGLRSLNGTTTNSAPGGVKAECSNCGATHTPLWRRGLNDELNCNACGLYCKLHKRPRPKSMRNSHGERAQAPPRQETVDVMGLSSPVTKPPPRCSSPVNRTAQCYNCHTTATPLWRKDDEGKTVCNACGLYYKLHGSARPISMKSDVIRKRSRHDTRRGNPDTPSASPGVSRRASPVQDASPTLAPDSSTAQINYDYSEDLDFRTTQSELLGALGQDLATSNMFFPGPYNPDYLSQIYPMTADPLPFPPAESVETVEHEITSPRSNKRRRMSTDSASEPPSSSTTSSSFSSFTSDGYLTSASSATTHSQRSSMEFPFSSFLSSTNTGSCNGNSNYNSSSGSPNGGSGPALRGSGNTFWHPPMLPQVENSPQLFHPPMLPPADESPMDFLQAPIHHDDDMLFSTFFHPPMAVPEENNNHSSGTIHPPMVIDYTQHNDSYDSSMRVY